MEGVERTNTVMVNPQQMAGFPLRNSYAMDVDKRINRNCYTCRSFGHMAKNCRNWRVGVNRRIEVKQDNNNLNGDRGLGSPD